MKFVGTVVEDRFAPGSKSERSAVFLQTATERLLLRRADGNALHDPDLEKWIGLRVQVDGRVHRSILIAQAIRLLPQTI